MTVVSIYTQVYNTKPFLSRCIESVLNQTFADFEYILIDNGSTDGGKELMEQYAAQDDRVDLIRYEKNTPAPIWIEIAKKTGTGKYIAEVDSDDWLEPRFLEQLVGLAEKNRLDMACTGTAFHVEGQESVVSGNRSFPQQMICDRTEFSNCFPYYHAFFRTVWAKLIRREVFMSTDLSIIDREKIINGEDTLAAFACLRQAKRICIDNSILHHYLVRRKSVSRVYLPNRFKSNTVLHQDAVNFLSQYGPVSRQNLHFLHIVYANAVSDTLEVLWGADLLPAEKLAEYCRIAVHPTTRAAYGDIDAAIDRSRDTLLRQMLSVAAKAAEIPEEFPQALRTLLPQCGHAFTKNTLPLLQREPALLDALCRDDWDMLVGQVMRFIVEKKYTKQFDLLELLNNLIPSANPLKAVDDVRFFRQYTEISMLMLCGNYRAALEQMTDLLLSGQTLLLEELFLQLYLMLAALVCQEAAFIFGKIRLAQLYLEHENVDGVRSILVELEEIGVQPNEELAQLYRQLEAII